jgi:hypothetical protein
VVPYNADTAGLLARLRIRFWKGKDAVLWPEAHLRVTLDELFLRNGEFLVTKTGGSMPSGYALAIPNGDAVKIIECASSAAQNDMVTSLRSYYRDRSTLFSLAEGVARSCAEAPYGLLHTTISGRAPYLNLALDF